VPLWRVRAHATSQSRSIKISIDGTHTRKIILHGHRCPPDHQLKPRILNEVAQALSLPVKAVSVRGYDDRDWIASSVPRGRRGPIAGLRIYTGFVCLLCDRNKEPYCALTLSTIKYHLKSCPRRFVHPPPKRPWYRDGAVQTLCHDNGLVRYFLVPQERRGAAQTDVGSG
jgi:hypothetical protein